MSPIEIKLKGKQKLSSYKNKWLALSDKREIIAASLSAETAYNSAKKKGVSDPILTRVPNKLGSYIL